LGHYTLDRLLAGELPKDFLFFWGHTAKDGSIGAHCLSQWFPARFSVDGLSYPSAEHFMMASKARLFGDHRTLAKILVSAEPKDAKALGRMVIGFDSALWEAHGYDFVVEANLAKFGQNPDLKSYLISTHPKVLVEASPVDPVWGIGLASDDVRAQDPTQWLGRNLLGFALMETRQQLM
jgi:ribA/ribD-fused uncharacterized protein